MLLQRDALLDRSDYWCTVALLLLLGANGPGSPLEASGSSHGLVWKFLLPARSAFVVSGFMISALFLVNFASYPALQTCSMEPKDFEKLFALCAVVDSVGSGKLPFGAVVVEVWLGIATLSLGAALSSLCNGTDGLAKLPDAPGSGIAMGVDLRKDVKKGIRHKFV